MASSTNSMWQSSNLLDQHIPLAGASHAEAVGYTIVIPMRYTECEAKLHDGRRVRLVRPRQLVGWRGQQGQRTCLFDCGGRGFELYIDEVGMGGPRPLRDGPLTIYERPFADLEGIHKYVAPDGSIVFARVANRTNEKSEILHCRSSVGLATLDSPN